VTRRANIPRRVGLAAAFAGLAATSWAQESSGQSPFDWPRDTVCAVSLSYDDSVPVHHQRVAPLLEQHGLRATFYLTVSRLGEPVAWKTVAAKGHELGNHSLFHPCRREPPESYGWLPAHYDLADYTLERFRDELATANATLDLLDGGRPRTYGNNCTHLTVGRGEREVPMDPVLRELFVAARGAITNRPVDPRRPELTRLGHYSGDGRSFEQLSAEIEDGCRSGGWSIYMFHGVGAGTHDLFVAEDEHRKLVEWLDRQRARVWTAPVVDVASHLQSQPGGAPPAASDDRR
jgi:hypothetical protein